MIRMLLSFVLVMAAITGQSQNLNPAPQSAAPHPENDARKSIRPEDPVVTISGICRERPAKSADSAACKTIITKEQFDRVIAALAVAGQQVPSSARRQFAQSYVDLLAYQKAASDLESSPEFQDLMDLVRLRTLSDIHRRNLQARYHAPSSEDIEAYYRQHTANFTDIRIRRILIPRRNPSAGDQGKYEKQALQVAHDLREKAARGEDVDQLQKQGYASLGLVSPPGTDLGNRRITNLVADIRDEIMALNPGGVSKVEEEAYSFVIYKVDGKAVLAQDTVKDEISREISRQRMESAVKEITSGVHPEFNEQYFPAPPSPPAHPSALAPTQSAQAPPP